MKTEIFKIGTAVLIFGWSFAIFWFFFNTQEKKEHSAIEKKVYYFKDPVDNYHDTLMNYGQRMYLNQLWNETKEN